MDNPLIESAKRLQLHVEIMTGRTGVSITGIPICDMTEKHIKIVGKLVSEFCVAVLPNQHLKPEEHIAFFKRFGPLMTTPGFDCHPEWPEIQLAKKRGGRGEILSGPFHTDTCFVAKPPSYSSLNAAKVPKHGGDTVFLNQYLAYESLSDVMKGWLKGLKFKHVVYGIDRPEEVPDPVWHPAVRTNPVTRRKSLYITMPMRCVEASGMSREEGNALISFLYEHSQKLHTMYRHRWSPGDLLMWDNRCSLHAAVADHEAQTRILHRLMCQGEVPSED